MYLYSVTVRQQVPKYRILVAHYRNVDTTGSRVTSVKYHCHKAASTLTVIQKPSLADAIVVPSGLKIVPWSLYSTWLFHYFNA